ncbi:MAG TPA: cytochrome c biogenesis protein CcdA [Saprospiraceae bacterium]|nr:cytochrome c biogenesis protein CcdA [Saprospiraceae bacterium]
MKRILLLVSLVFAYLSAQAQFPTPVSWSAKWEAVSDTEYELIFTAEIDPGWNIYSQYLESEDGPIATQLNFTSPDGLETLGKSTEEGIIKKGYDDIFQMNVTKIFDQAVIRQRVKLSDLPKTIDGYITYMVCDDEMCLPPTDYEFSLKITAPGGSAAAETDAPPLLSDDPLLSDASPRNPVQWSVSINDLGNQEYELIWTADFAKPWTLYAQEIEGDGPIPTTFTLDAGAHYQAVGATTEAATKVKDGYDEIFGIDVKKFVEGPAIFTQKIKVSDPNVPITGELVFMTCDDEMCLPPDYRYYQFTPVTGAALLGLEPIEGEKEAAVAVDEATETLYGALAKPDLENPMATCTPESAKVEKNSSMLRIFFLGILGGLIALLTPCVFPMIPLTVSFFTKRSNTRAKGTRNAFIYGGFIVLVYLLLSLPFHLLDTVSPDILNQISTNIWLNLSFFVIFLVFAFSFFGFFEITLPSSWTNKSTQAEGVGGAIGIFFMALTLALVSFSCTGPILGTLLVGALSSDGGAWQLTSGMAGFGVGLALPFGIFAAFPGFMSSLPKSGGWLNTVKVTLGFLELALALKFLSNADMVKHWGILKVELFLGLWIVIFAALALYLFGIIRFPHDSKGQKIPLVQKILGGLSAAFVIYLATGFTVNPEMGSYRPLKLLSGLAPPVCYSYLKPCDCPQQLTCFKDLKEGLAYAKKQNKPVLLDFTGYACVNCRKMEEHVWPEPEVYPYLKDDFVLISLYVDDKKELPEEQQLRVKTFQGTKTLRTYGNKWSYFQETYFNAVAQPYYVLVTPELELLNAPAAYTPDEQQYAQFLECGKQTYNSLAEQ